MANAHELLGRTVFDLEVRNEEVARLKDGLMQALTWIAGIQSGQIDVRRFKVDILGERCELGPELPPAPPSASEEEEKRRRVYYQDIVYAVAAELDRAFGKESGERVACGTVDTPSTQVQETLRLLVRKYQACVEALKEARDMSTAVYRDEEVLAKVNAALGTPETHVVPSRNMSGCARSGNLPDSKMSFD